ncbi:hypothetical protein LCGC14_2684660, partial [marine sediment metagenome]
QPVWTSRLFQDTSGQGSATAYLEPARITIVVTKVLGGIVNVLVLAIMMVVSLALASFIAITVYGVVR